MEAKRTEGRIGAGVSHHFGHCGSPVTQSFVLDAEAACNHRLLHLSPKTPQPVNLHSNPMLCISVLISVEEGEQFN